METSSTEPVRHRVAFRVITENLSAGEITRFLGSEPTASGATDHGETVWTLTFDSESGEDLDATLRSLATWARKCLPGIRQLQATGSRTDIFIGVFDEQPPRGNFGFRIERETLRQLRELGLDLEFDIYSVG